MKKCRITLAVVLTTTLFSASAFAETGEECVNRLLDVFESYDQQISALDGGEITQVSCTRNRRGGASILIRWGCGGDQSAVSWNPRVARSNVGLECRISSHVVSGSPCSRSVVIPEETGTEPLDSRKDYARAKRELLQFCSDLLP